MVAVQTRYPGILIESNHPVYARNAGGLAKHEFYRRTLNDLDYLYGFTNLGRELLQLIAKRSQGIGTSLTKNGVRTVEIRFRPVDKSDGASTGAMLPEDRFSKVRTLSGGRKMHMAGSGSRSVIAMHNSRDSEAFYTRLATVRTPTWMALFHELTHAWHHLSGTSYSDSVTTNSGETVRREEMWTTGLGVYRDTRISENALRREVNLPERRYYTFPNDHTHIGSLRHYVSSVVPQGGWHCSCLQQSVPGGDP